MVVVSLAVHSRTTPPRDMRLGRGPCDAHLVAPIGTAAPGGCIFPVHNVRLRCGWPCDRRWRRWGVGWLGRLTGRCLRPDAARTKGASVSYGSERHCDRVSRCRGIAGEELVGSNVSLWLRGHHPWFLTVPTNVPGTLRKRQQTEALRDGQNEPMVHQDGRACWGCAFRARARGLRAFLLCASAVLSSLDSRRRRAAAVQGLTHVVMHLPPLSTAGGRGSASATLIPFSIRPIRPFVSFVMIFSDLCSSVFICGSLLLPGPEGG